MSNLRRDARCLIRQREPIHCYWQLFFPTRFNELHKGARHASRRSFRFLSKPVAPIAKRSYYKGCASIPEIPHLHGIICCPVASHVVLILRSKASCTGG